MADINTVAQQFADFYYKTFDSDRKNLVPLYREHSMLTFEGQQTLGANSIVEKLVAMPFQRVQHVVSTIDAQPSHPSLGSIVINITGKLLVDDEQNPQQFSQTFHLYPENGSYWVYNDIFRLNYG
ncbi:Nuclear transport factor 2 [Dimargaris verticillata]|uniref:Nuclear transport factor 2 n=1 Tax=Dimargaris verticillata TaxID=2761393 RepID=A0A9W8BBQ4_9FUNG|nr:Nuclear transport factor 2 [Dimargaris verticillata]